MIQVLAAAGYSSVPAWAPAAKYLSFVICHFLFVIFA